VIPSQGLIKKIQAGSKESGEIMLERVIWLMKFGIHHIPQLHTHQRRLQRKKVTTPKIWVIICASSHAIWRRQGLTQRYGMRHGVHEV
jgi:hypothetical protein